MTALACVSSGAPSSEPSNEGTAPLQPSGDCTAEPLVEPSGECIVDEEGKPLCTSALWGMRCGNLKRWGKCTYSHRVPDHLRSQYDRLREARLAEQRATNSEKQRLKRVPAPPPAPVPESIEWLRREAVLWYSPELVAALVKAISAVLECSPGERLEDIHLRAELPEEPPLCPTLHHAFRLGGRKIPNAWRAVMGSGRNRRVIARLLASKPYAVWLDAYDAWVRAVLWPALGGGGFYYQRPPTLRVALPSAHQATIGVHRDADYHGHHAAEINFWCPLVPVAGSSALWLESAPELGDFAPRPLDLSSVLRFNGSLCRHYTQPNQSGATRVSFDLRVIPESAVCSGEEPPAMIGDYPCSYMPPKS